MRRVAAIAVVLCAFGVVPAAHATFPGQNGKIAFVHWADDDTWHAIYTVNPDSSDLTRLGHGYEPEWSPDGTKIAFSYQSEIWIMDADGSNRTQVTTTGGQDPAWSPSGDELVFVGPDFERDLMVINVDGTDLRTIHTDGCDFAPDWSPSGTEIAVQSICGGDGLVAVSPDGGTVRDLGVFGGAPDWSPGGAWLTLGGGPGIAVISAQGGPIARIGGDPQPGLAAWSPDGSRIVYSPGDNGNTRPDGIFHMNLVGGDLVEVVPTMRRKHFPTWQPLPPGPPHPNGYARSKGATPFHASLVPAYAACEAPNRAHGPPLSFDACAPPKQTSSTLTVGTPDANGQPVRSLGYLQVNVLPGDVRIDFQMSDIRCRWAAGGCTGALSDYTAALQLSAVVRPTDRWNIGAGLEAATGIDLEAFNLPIRGIAQCTPTPDPSVGSTCSLNTTVNALAPGTVRAGSRTIWALRSVQVYDSGPDGEPTSDDNELFATQGVFVP